MPTFPLHVSYDDGKLPIAARQEVTLLLAALLRQGSSGLCGGNHLSLATSLVDTGLSEIGHALLDKPVVYAPAIVRALNSVSARIQEMIATQEAFDEEACTRAAADILYLIVREACPYYLAEAPDPGGVTQRREARTEALPTGLQLAAEEWIAAQIHDFPSENNLLDPEECRTLSHNILLGILKCFRPALVLRGDTGA